MSERMTDDMWHGGQHSMTREALHAEGTRARTSEDQKEAVIKALADALGGIRAALTQNHTYPADVNLAVSLADAALRLAGRL